MIRRFTLAVALFIAGIGAVHAVPTLTLTPSAATVTVGSSFSLSIGIQNVDDLYAWEANLLFGPVGMVNATAQAEGDFLGVGTTFVPGTVDNGLGTIAYIASALSGPTGVSGSGLLATITFDALAIGVANFSFESVLLLNSNLDSIFPGDLVPATVTISVVPEPATLALMAMALAALLAHQRRRTVPH